MTIYVMCVNDETGKTLAISAEDPTIREYGWNGHDEAVGALVVRQAGLGKPITVDRVVFINTSEQWPPPGAPADANNLFGHACNDRLGSVADHIATGKGPF